MTTKKGMIRKMAPYIAIHLLISTIYSFVIYWKYIHQTVSRNIIVVGYQQIVAFLIHFLCILIFVSFQKEGGAFKSFKLNLVGFLIACFIQFFVVGYFVDPLID